MRSFRFSASTAFVMFLLGLITNLASEDIPKWLIRTGGGCGRAALVLVGIVALAEWLKNRRDARDVQVTVVPVDALVGRVVWNVPQRWAPSSAGRKSWTR